MRDDVDDLTPSRDTGFSNLFDVIDNGRRRREHNRLLLKNRVRNRAKVFGIPAPFLLLVGVVLFGVRL